MKKILSILFLLCTLAVYAQEPVKIIPKPANSLVYDEANALSPDQKQLLDQQLIALDDSTSNQIGVAIVKSLNGGSLEDVAVQTYRSWGLGSKKNNNGVLILIATEDRKVKIEVGYGLEGAIPDAAAGSIIRNDLTPYFKENDYYHGLLKAVDDLGRAASGEYRIARENTGSGAGGAIIFKFIVIAIIIIVLIGRGGRGGRGGNMMSRRGSGWLGPMIIGSMLNNGGGGGFGGGSSGGFGGGGFGGFGGGSSGGGGASGSW